MQYTFPYFVKMLLFLNSGCICRRLLGKDNEGLCRATYRILDIMYIILGLPRVKRITKRFERGLRVELNFYLPYLKQHNTTERMFAMDLPHCSPIMASRSSQDRKYLHKMLKRYFFFRILILSIIFQAILNCTFFITTQKIELNLKVMEDQDKLDWKKYEFITKYIYETLGQMYNINIEGYGKDCKIWGSSGVEHQVDVLTSETDSTGTFRTAIECKYWNKKVTKDTVMKLLAILDDTNIKRGIIVSRSGFTPDAQQYAKHKNILLVQLREAGKEDNERPKELCIDDLNLNVKLTRRHPEVTSIIAMDFDNNKITLDEKDQYHIFIENTNGKKSRLFDDIMEFKCHLHGQKPFATVTKTHAHQQSLLYFQNNIFKIKSITYTGLLTIHDQNQNKIFSIVDRVWLVMEKIFEQQTFMISESGLIVKQG